MRTFNLITASLFGLVLIASTSACQDDGGADTTEEETTTGDGDGDNGDGDGDPGDGDGDPGDGDGDPTGGECYPQPEECALFLRCLGAIAPSQLPAVEEQYGEGGSCWCTGEPKAQECYATCVTEVQKAVSNFPTESACHESVCALEDLDPTQPYGPIVNGSCSEYTTEQGAMAAQMPFQNPLGLPGGFCAPRCSGIANYCPDHTQTAAAGTCFLTVGQDNYCISRCWVDPTVVGGTQCQCGATCQPQGGPDGEGNLRGICTFE